MGTDTKFISISMKQILLADIIYIYIYIYLYLIYYNNISVIDIGNKLKKINISIGFGMIQLPITDNRYRNL